MKTGLTHVIFFYNKTCKQTDVVLAQAKKYFVSE